MTLPKMIVEQQIRRIGKFDSFGTKKEINFLPEILRENEEIFFLTSGTYDRNTWLITATNFRLIFLDKGLIFGLKQIEFPYDKISSICQKTGLMMGKILIGTSSGEVKIDNIAKGDVPKIIEVISKYTHSGYVTETQPSIKEKNKTSVRASEPQAQVDIATQLQKLGDMRLNGLLTEEEFTIAKTSLLSKTTSSKNETKEELEHTFEQQQSSLYTVILCTAAECSFSARIEFIKELRAVAHLGIKEAKEIVDTTPSIVKQHLSKENAEFLRDIISSYGADSKIQPE